MILISLKCSRSFLVRKDLSITLLPCWKPVTFTVTPLFSLTQWGFQLINNSQSELPHSVGLSRQLKLPTMIVLAWQHWKASVSAWYIISKSVFGGKFAHFIIGPNSLICIADNLVLMSNNSCNSECLLSATKPHRGHPITLFIAFVQKNVKPGILTVFTVNISVHSKISYAIASLVHVDNV